jgi:spore coat polysaccharide biosynthesis protein SpsF
MSSQISCGAILLGRLDSSRLPGKVLADVAGRPLLWYVLTRCQHVHFDKIVVATSNRALDDPIVKYCQQNDVNVFRGDVLDVAGRVLMCARHYHMDYFARINADSPFVEPSLLQEALKLARLSEYDFITNLQPRSFPYGVSVEVFKVSTFAQGYDQMTNADEHEHVTKYFYDHLDNYRYANIQREGDLSQLRLTIDTPNDLRRFRTLIDTMLPTWDSLSYKDVIEFYQKVTSDDD